MRLGKWTLLAGRSMVEINQYCQTYLYLNGEAIPTNQQYESIRNKIDQMLDKMEANAPCPAKA